MPTKCCRRKQHSMPPESSSGKELRRYITVTCVPTQSNLTVVQEGKKAPIPSLLPLFSSVRKRERKPTETPSPLTSTPGAR